MNKMLKEIEEQAEREGEFNTICKVSYLCQTYGTEVVANAITKNKYPNLYKVLN